MRNFMFAALTLAFAATLSGCRATPTTNFVRSATVQRDRPLDNFGEILSTGKKADSAPRAALPADNFGEIL